jgi:hypothetical protein
VIYSNDPLQLVYTLTNEGEADVTIPALNTKQHYYTIVEPNGHIFDSSIPMFTYGPLSHPPDEPPLVTLKPKESYSVLLRKSVRPLYYFVDQEPGAYRLAYHLQTDQGLVKSNEVIIVIPADAKRVTPPPLPWDALPEG